MFKKLRFDNHDKLIETLLGVFILVFCLSLKLSNIILIFLGLVVIYGVFKYRSSFKFNSINFSFLLLYLSYAVGVIFTKNESLAFFYLENKLPFVVFPFVFSFIDSSKLNFTRLNNFLITGVLALALMGFINGIHCKLYNLNEYCFSTTSFSFVHHPTYYLVFNCISFCFLVIQFFKQKTTLTKVILYLLASFVIHILSLSLAGILFFAFAIFIFSIYFFYTKFSRTLFLISLFSLFLLSIITASKVRVLKNELNGAAKYVSSYSNSPSDFVKNSSYPMEGNNARLVMWTVAFQLCVEHPFGVGTGNVDETLQHKLIEFGQPELAKLNYNPHNQFLQTFLEIGFFGLFILIFIIIYSIYLGIKHKEYLLIIISLSLLFNGLFESMLQRQSGIVFYTLFFCLLSSYYPRRSINQ
jgi:O-antigen ligase